MIYYLAFINFFDGSKLPWYMKRFSLLTWISWQESPPLLPEKLLYSRTKELVILEHLYSIGVRHHKLSEIVIISCETVFYVCELLFCYFKIIIKLFTLLSIAFNILLLMCFVCDLFWMVLSIVHSLWLSDISIFSTSRETFYAYIILLKWLEQLNPF